MKFTALCVTMVTLFGYSSLQKVKSVLDMFPDYAALKVKLAATEEKAKSGEEKIRLMETQINDKIKQLKEQIDNLKGE